MAEEPAACNVLNMYHMLLISSGLIWDVARKESDLLIVCSLFVLSVNSVFIMCVIERRNKFCCC